MLYAPEGATGITIKNTILEANNKVLMYSLISNVVKISS
jgi:hypothetical protein